MVGTLDIFNEAVGRLIEKHPKDWDVIQDECLREVERHGGFLR